MLPSTMQDRPLTVNALFAHGRAIYPESEVITFTGDGTRRARFAQVAERTERLAAALRRLGVGPSDRVATFCWNAQEHLEAYLAIPCMGAVLHTLNLRLAAEQIAFIATHAEDKVVIVDDSLLPLFAPLREKLTTVEHVIVVGEGGADALPGALRYEDLLAAEEPGFEWPEIDERQAAAMCYTSGTTGNPKGVVYSHRSTFLHSLATTSGEVFALNRRDRVLPVVPMFHANAWGLPYSAWMVGASLAFPGRFMQADAIARFIELARPTFAGAVPTIWNDLLAQAEGRDLSSLQRIVCGGSAVPRALMERFAERFGVQIVQAWGMTETSPLASVAHPPPGLEGEAEMLSRVKQGAPVVGVDLRLCADDGSELPWDGEAIGEIEVRGPWVTSSYYRDETPEKFHDGWLRTGDVGTVDPHGFIQITDRSKDVIKSGGEWISSVELENAIMAHEQVREAAVVGVPDAKWDERPLACVVLADGAKAGPAELAAFLAERVVKWWIPERWTFIPEVPRTSVGKFDKKVLRAQHAAGELEVVEHRPS